MKIGDYATGPGNMPGEIVGFTYCRASSFAKDQKDVKYAVIKTAEFTYQSPVHQVKIVDKPLKNSPTHQLTLFS